MPHVNWDWAATIAVGIAAGHIIVLVVQAVIRTIGGK